MRMVQAEVLDEAMAAVTGQSSLVTAISNALPWISTNQTRKLQDGLALRSKMHHKIVSLNGIKSLCPELRRSSDMILPKFSFFASGHTQEDAAVVMVPSLPWWTKRHSQILCRTANEKLQVNKPEFEICNEMGC